MTLTAKRRLLFSLLMVVLAWPLVHRKIVADYLVNPWRLFGWAMYCVPDHPPTLRLVGSTSEGMGVIEYPRDNERGLVVLNEFISDREQLGRLVEPVLVAAYLFERYPPLTSLLVAVDQPVWDPESSSFRVVVDEYSYKRSATPIG